MKTIIFLTVILASGICMAASALTVEFREGEAVLQVQETPLGKVVEEIRQAWQVEITGLENKTDEIISFSAAEETPEDVLKRLLRYLGEPNYAFEFTDIKLTRVSVVPESGFIGTRPFKSEEAGDQDSVSAVQVIGVLDGTQGETIGLEKGDLIVEYDGVKISSAQQLVEEVKKKSETDSVELVAVRDHTPMRFVLNGGFIGVRITTAKIPKSKADY
jgi:hypothetical protein